MLCELLPFVFCSNAIFCSHNQDTSTIIFGNLKIFKAKYIYWISIQTKWKTIIVVYNVPIQAKCVICVIFISKLLSHTTYIQLFVESFPERVFTDLLIFNITNLFGMPYFYIYNHKLFKMLYSTHLVQEFSKCYFSIFSFWRKPLGTCSANPQEAVIVITKVETELRPSLCFRSNFPFSWNSKGMRFVKIDYFKNYLNFA